ncbi:MAG: hypothetical protein K6G69_01130, partial [Lachnospiraceae bacterium]|nr:hypothetical protein [Lachnospiraceae bacterium]
MSSVFADISTLGVTEEGVTEESPPVEHAQREKVRHSMHVVDINLFIIYRKPQKYQYLLHFISYNIINICGTKWKMITTVIISTKVPQKEIKSLCKLTLNATLRNVKI